MEEVALLDCDADALDCALDAWLEAAELVADELALNDATELVEEEMACELDESELLVLHMLPQVCSKRAQAAPHTVPSAQIALW
jgi:hypothetical protein